MRVFSAWNEPLLSGGVVPGHDCLISYRCVVLFMNNTVIIFDTTLRDGEQSPGASMNVEEKITVAKQLERLGVDVIEAGFPVASPGDFEAVKRISATIDRAAVAALARAKIKDIDVAYDAIKDAKRPRIHTFLSTSDIHLEFQLKKTSFPHFLIELFKVRRFNLNRLRFYFFAIDIGR